MKPLLTIAIATIEGREKQFKQLTKDLKAQLIEGVEIIYLCDNKELSIGAKRQQLLIRFQSRR